VAGPIEKNSWLRQCSAHRWRNQGGRMGLAPPLLLLGGLPLHFFA